jgi:predicted deacylase
VEAPRSLRDPGLRPAAADQAGFAQYNLAEGRYVFDLHSAGTGDMAWKSMARAIPRQASFYSADNLRAISDR